jgi:hypothetical protein
MISTSGSILDQLHPVVALHATVPSSTTPAYVSCKLLLGAMAHIIVTNTTGVTGSAIGLQQATAVAGTSAKTLAFTDYYSRTDALGTDAPWTRNAAASNTFTTSTTASKVHEYCIPIYPATLDTNNSFDCFGVTTGNAVNATVTITYWTKPAYGGNPATFLPLDVD